MRVRFRVGDQWPTGPARKRLEGRLRIAVGRRSPSISALDVSLVSKPLRDPVPNDADLTCRIRARFRSGDDLVVVECGANLEAALEVAAWRLAHRLDRPKGREGSPRTTR